MKNSILKFSFTALAALTLAACGSSGGGDSNPAPSNNTQQQAKPNNSQTTTNSNSNSQANNQAKPSNNQSQASASNKTGAALVVKGSDGNISSKNVTLTDPSFTQINVDGKVVPIGFGPGISSYGWSSISSRSINGVALNGKLEVCCGKYSNVRFGAIESQEEGQDDILFYNGNTTKNMPTSGVVTYKGDSLISAEKLTDDYTKGSSQFSADFGSKKLTGSLEATGAKVNVTADISGNGFAGTATSSELGQGTVEGKFYGDNAKELGGLVKGNDNKWAGSFAASK